MTTGWYALVDAAADEGLWPLIERCEKRACLLSGKLHPVLAAAAPYLVALNDNEPLLPAWREQGVGKAWGFMVEAEMGLEPLRKQFRRFLQAMLPDGTIAQFRVYDPRIFATYLPAAPPEQQAQWFEGVRQYAVEGANKTQHSFRLRQGRLFDGDTPLAA